ncbi:MAG: hypothetical protein HKO53_11305 [Gemmatimonadetes bacterium]|nr:hypothetical protein [Gemmatimonadota bacterium]
MKRWAFLLLAICTLTGCIQRSERIQLNADGSGTLHVEAQIPAGAVATMEKLLTHVYEEIVGSDLELLNVLLQEQGMEPVTSLDQMGDAFGFSQASLEELCERTQAELVDYVEETTEETALARFEIRFTSVGSLNEILSGIGDEKARIEIERRDEAFALRRVDLMPSMEELMGSLDEPEPDADTQVEGLAELNEKFENDPVVMGLMMEMMGSMMTTQDLEIVHTITVPGEVEDHNADSVEGRTATWTMGLAGLMEGAMGAGEEGTGSLDALGERWVVFSAEGLDLPEVGASGR